MLNEKQLIAVNLPIDRPALVLAGAGTGKTHVLTNRIMRLHAREGIAPERILAVSFTKKSANELKERLIKLHPSLGFVKAGTFHSAAIEMLRDLKTSGVGIGIPRRNFSILDQSDQKRMVREIIKTEGHCQDYFEKDADAVNACLKHINWHKENMQRRADIKEDGATPTSVQYMNTIYGLYEKRCKKEFTYDFTEIILVLVIAMRDHTSTRRYIASRFDAVLIDEFQDINALQSYFIDLILNKRGCFSAIGDNDQSIYLFRGARPDIILSFADRYKGANIATLEQNYRSTQEILTAANNVIAYNTGRYDKSLFTKITSKETCISSSSYPNIYAEAEGVISCIAEAVRNGEKAKDFAILIRSNFLSMPLEKEFAYYATPYQMTGGRTFFQREEIKAALAYLRLLSNSLDTNALRQAIDCPKRRIGDVGYQTVLIDSQKHQVSLIESLSAQKKKGCLELYDVLMNLRDVEQNGLAALIHASVHDSGVYQHYSDALNNEHCKDVESAQNRINNLDSLIAVGERFGDCSLTEFLEQIAFSTEGNQKGDPNDCVTISTIHGAKGLEYKHVYLIGMGENIFPSKRSIEDYDPEVIQEERRLAYVALTRAKEKLHISYSRKDFYGNEVSPSRFLSEMALDVETNNYT